MPSSRKSSIPPVIVLGNHTDTIYQGIILTQWGVSGTTQWGLIKRIFNIWINEEQNNWNKGINVLFFFKLNGSLTGNKLPPMIRVAFLLAWQCPPHRASTLWWAIILSVKTLIGGRPSLENPNNMKIKAPLLNSGRWVFYGEGFFALLYIILPMLLVLRWLLSGTIWVNSHLSQTGMTK